MTIYIANISEFGDLCGAELLSYSRKTACAQYTQTEDQARCLVAGLLLRYVLGDEANKICLTPYGKPYLSDDCIHFNLSHGGEFVVLAVDNHELGIDIEPLSDVPNGISEFTFVPEEIQWLRSHTDNLSFYKLWTGKESILKASGFGFHFSANSFSVLPAQSGLHSINGITWYMKWYSLYNHCICVSSQHDSNLDFVFLHRKQLLI